MNQIFYYDAMEVLPELDVEKDIKGIKMPEGD
jgi:hypothetical protein